MTKILHIISSPRGANSKSNALASGFIADLRLNTPEVEVDTLDLWAEDLPEFDGDPAAAKMTFFGDGTMDPAKQAAWDKVEQITRRFIDANHYVLGVPMWNGGVPYRLKHYIDIITQPGLLFGFAPETGYSGLLTGKKATVVTTSGVWSPGAPASYGQDHHSTYLEWWFNFIGVQDLDIVRFQPSLLTQTPTEDYAKVRAHLQTMA